MPEKITNNFVYRSKEGGSCWRAVFQKKDTDQLAICEINEKYFEKSRLTIVSLRKYEDLVISNFFVIDIEQSFLHIPCENDLSDTQKTKRDTRLALIKPALTKGIELFERVNRSQILSQIAKDKLISLRSLGRYLNLYFAKGGLPVALVPDYTQCGAPAAQRNSSKKLGRPSGANFGMPLRDSDKALIKKGFLKFYANNGSASLNDAFRRTINEFFFDKNQPESMRPSIWQFKRWGKKAISPAKLEELRSGSIIYDKDRRLLKGHANQRVYGPGSLYQIDSTPANFNLVSTFDPNLSIGRPTLYIITDVYSRMVVGFFITLEHASYSSAAQAIYNAAVNKVEFCKRYGLTIEPSDWPSTGLPSSLLSDRGELIGDKGNTLVANLAITLKTAKRYRPDWKGNVESLLKNLQARVENSCNEKGRITKLDRTIATPSELYKYTGIKKRG